MSRNKTLIVVATIILGASCRSNQDAPKTDDMKLYEGTVRAFLEVESPRAPVDLPDDLSGALRIQAKIALLLKDFEADVGLLLNSSENFSTEARDSVNAILDQANLVRSMCYPDYNELQVAKTSDYVAKVTDQYRILFEIVKKLPPDYEKVRQTYQTEE